MIIYLNTRDQSEKNNKKIKIYRQKTWMPIMKKVHCIFVNFYDKKVVNSGVYRIEFGGGGCKIGHRQATIKILFETRSWISLKTYRSLHCCVAIHPKFFGGKLTLNLPPHRIRHWWQIHNSMAKYWLQSYLLLTITCEINITVYWYTLKY